MDNDRSFNFALLTLFLMNLSLSIPLIVIGVPMWVFLLVSIAVFGSALSGSVVLAYIYRILHNIVLRPGLYIWAVIVAIKGPQDFVAICFYIVALLQAWNIIKNCIGEIIQIIAAN